jgi:hypothetical protein
MKLRPSEYFARQCTISFEVGERTLPMAAPLIGPERVVWGSDYPHHDATFPGAVDAIRATIAPCPTATQVRVLGLNARRIHRLPSRLVGPAAIIGDYFGAVTARDETMLRDLFSPGAVLESGDVHLEGREEILGYYRSNTFTFSDFRPDPGPLEINGNQVTVDLRVYLGGAERAVHDVFDTDAGRITALRISGFEDALRAARSD